MANFLKAALDKVFTEGNEFPSVTYETPPAVVKYMEMQSSLGNPPWKNNDLQEKITYITEWIYGKRNDHTMKFNHNDFTFNVDDNYVNIVENDFFKRIYFKIPIEDLKLDNQTIIFKIIYPKKEPITK
jgi:hypothetical protein